MIDFVEGLPTEWQQTWNHMRLKSGRHDWTSKLIFNAMLVIFKDPDQSPRWVQKIQLVLNLRSRETLTAEFVSEWPPRTVETRARI
jgi:hypothetical protein